MNWYKKAMHDDFNWGLIFKELREELGRSPNADEVSEEMLRRIFNPQFKKIVEKKEEPVEEPVLV